MCLVPVYCVSVYSAKEGPSTFFYMAPIFALCPLLLPILHQAEAAASAANSSSGPGPPSLSQLISSGEIAFGIFSVDSLDALELDQGQRSQQRVFHKLADTGMLDLRRAIARLVRERKESKWSAEYANFVGFVEHVMQDMAAMVRCLEEQCYREFCVLVVRCHS
jgi:hypothetical protein